MVWGRAAGRDEGAPAVLCRGAPRLPPSTITTVIRYNPLVLPDDCLQVGCPGSLQAGPPLPPNFVGGSLTETCRGAFLSAFSQGAGGPESGPVSPVLSPSLQSVPHGQLLGTAGVVLVDTGGVSGDSGRSL